MSKYRRAAKVDGNQTEIVEALRAIPNLTVALTHDDILVGYKGLTYWYEIKVSEKATIQPSQVDLIADWKGHYKIVWSLDMILEDLNIISHIK